MEISEHKNKDYIYHYCEEIQDIMGHVPGWIVRWGITLFFIILILLALGAWKFTYPDEVAARVLFSTEKPLFAVYSDQGGYVRWLKKDGQKISMGDPIAVVQTVAGLEQVQKLKSLILPHASGTDGKGNSVFAGNLEERFVKLKQEVLRWETDYLIKAPGSGYLLLPEHSPGFKATAPGTRIGSILPPDPGRLVAHCSVPKENQNQFRPGQKVTIVIKDPLKSRQMKYPGLIKEINPDKAGRTLNLTVLISSPVFGRDLENKILPVGAGVPGRIFTTSRNILTRVVNALGGNRKS